MKIIMSPAKKMEVHTDDFTVRDLPMFIEDAKKLKEILKSLSSEELQTMWGCSEKIVKQNEERLAHMNLEEGLTPAVFAYSGLAFQHLSPSSLKEEGLAWLQEHLRILSAFYGVVRPFDGVTPYRLEMFSDLPVQGSMYDWWKGRIHDAVSDDVIINLASKEYSKCVSDYLQDGERMITITFGEEKKGKIITKATDAKMARGDMVWWMADRNVQNPEEIKEFAEGWKFDEGRSSDTEFVFIKVK